jgi:Rieske Fe-S protein
MNDRAKQGDTQPPAMKAAELAAEPQPRRRFVTKFLALLVGGFAGLVPLVAGLGVLFDPLRSRQKRKGTNGTSNDAMEGFLKVASLDALSVGSPRPFVVVKDVVDAWNLFRNERVGWVYLLRKEGDTVQALNRTCPHLGCDVGYDPSRKLYQCPCHDSSFEIDGSLHNEKSPSARGLDSLEVRIENGDEVWVKYQVFMGATPEKIPVE